LKSIIQFKKTLLIIATNDINYFLRSEKKADYIFLALSMLNITIKLSAFIFWEMAMLFPVNFLTIFKAKIWVEKVVIDKLKQLNQEKQSFIYNNL